MHHVHVLCGAVMLLDAAVVIVQKSNCAWLGDWSSCCLSACYVYDSVYVCMCVQVRADLLTRVCVHECIATVNVHSCLLCDVIGIEGSI